MSIRKYSVAGTGPKAVVKIEIEVTDPYDLGFLMSELAQAQRKLAEKRAAKAAEEKRLKQEQRAIGRQKMLALPDLRGRS